MPCLLSFLARHGKCTAQLGTQNATRGRCRLGKNALRSRILSTDSQITIPIKARNDTEQNGDVCNSLKISSIDKQTTVANRVVACLSVLLIFSKTQTIGVHLKPSALLPCSLTPLLAPSICLCSSPPNSAPRIRGPQACTPPPVFPQARLPADGAVIRVWVLY